MNDLTVKLPCPLGTKVYVVHTMWDHVCQKCRIVVIQKVFLGILKSRKNKPCIAVGKANYKYLCFNSIETYPISDLNVKVFLCKREALKKRDECRALAETFEQIKESAINSDD